MIFDAEANIRILKEFLSLFSENDFVLGETFSFFTARYQWIIRRNAFLSSFLPILSALMESGIYSRWEHYSWLLSTYWAILGSRTKIFKSLKESKTVFDSNDNILAYLLFESHTAKPISETEKSISMDFFAIFLLFYGYCVVFCSIIFLVEKFCMKRTVKLFCNEISCKPSYLNTSTESR